MSVGYDSHTMRVILLWRNRFLLTIDTPLLNGEGEIWDAFWVRNCTALHVTMDYTKLIYVYPMYLYEQIDNRWIPRTNGQ